MKYILFILIALLANMNQAKTINLCVELSGNLPYLGKPGEIGIFDDFLMELEAQQAFQIELHYFPWKRCLRHVETGEMDGALAVIFTEERDLIFAYPKTNEGKVDRSKVIWNAEYPVFSHKDSTLQWDGETFSQKDALLSTPLGYVTYNKLNDLGVLYDVSLEPEKGLELVHKKRLDGYVVERSIGEKILQKKQINQNFKNLDKAFLETDWYIVLSKTFAQTNPEDAQLFWASLAQIRETHSQSMYKKHMQLDSLP